MYNYISPFIFCISTQARLTMILAKKMNNQNVYITCLKMTSTEYLSKRDKWYFARYKAVPLKEGEHSYKGTSTAKKRKEFWEEHVVKTVSVSKTEKHRADTQKALSCVFSKEIAEIIVGYANPQVWRSKGGNCECKSCQKWVFRLYLVSGRSMMGGSSSFVLSLCSNCVHDGHIDYDPDSD